MFISFFFFQKSFLYDTMSKNMVEPERPQMTILRFTCWISKATRAQTHASARTPAWNNSPPTGRIFMKFGIWVFFENLSRKLKFY